MRIRLFNLMVSMIVVLTVQTTIGQSLHQWSPVAPDGLFCSGLIGPRWLPGNEVDFPGGNTLKNIEINNNHMPVMSMNCGHIGLINRFSFGPQSTISRDISGGVVSFTGNPGIPPDLRNYSHASHHIHSNLLISHGIGSPSMTPWNMYISTLFGGFDVYGDIVNQTQHSLIIRGDNQHVNPTMRYVFIGGDISGMGGLTIDHKGVAKVGHALSYNGLTSIRDGELWIMEHGNFTQTSDIQIGDVNHMSGVAKLYLAKEDGKQLFSKDIHMVSGNNHTRFIGSLNHSDTCEMSGFVTRSGGQLLGIEVPESDAHFHISGRISGNGPVHKTGAGTCILSGSNLYTGITTVLEGRLVLNHHNGNTLPAHHTIAVQGGTLHVAQHQTLQHLSVISGTLWIDSGVVLTINGSYTGGGTIHNYGTIVLTGADSFPGAQSTVSHMNNLTLSHSGGTCLNRDLYMSGTLTLENGRSNLGPHTLTFGPHSQLAKNGGDLMADKGHLIFENNHPISIPAHALVSNQLLEATVQGNGGVLLQTDLEILSYLHLQKGLLTLNQHTLLIHKATGGSTVSYVHTNGTGQLRINDISDDTACYFPVGNQYFNPCYLTNRTGTMDDFSVNIFDRFTEDATPYGADKNINRVNATWNINKHKNKHAHDQDGIDFVFQWNHQQVKGYIDDNIHYIYHYDSGNWDVQPQSGTVYHHSSTSTFHHTGYKGSFSPFAVGEAIQLLPVNLSFFTASQVFQQMDAELLWTTLSEHQHLHMEIQHSTDRNHWETIGITEGVGNTFEEQSYRFVHAQLTPGFHYYRLLQVDQDGQTVAYDDVAVDIVPVKTPAVVLYPNPANQMVHFQIPFTREVSVDIRLPDGSFVTSVPRIMSNPDFEFTVPLQGLPKGLYLLYIQQAQQPTIVQKLTIH